MLHHTVILYIHPVPFDREGKAWFVLGIVAAIPINIQHPKSIVAAIPSNGQQPKSIVAAIRINGQHPKSSRNSN